MKKRIAFLVALALVMTTLGGVYAADPPIIDTIDIVYEADVYNYRAMVDNDVEFVTFNLPVYEDMTGITFDFSSDLAVVADENDLATVPVVIGWNLFDFDVIKDDIIIDSYSVFIVRRTYECVNNCDGTYDQIRDQIRDQLREKDCLEDPDRIRLHDRDQDKDNDGNFFQESNEVRNMYQHRGNK